MCALSVVDKWDAPQVVLDWLMTGDESIREEARVAANAYYTNAYANAYAFTAYAAAYAAAYTAHTCANKADKQDLRDLFDQLVREQFSDYL
jgi:hypothetical protein